MAQTARRIGRGVAVMLASAAILTLGACMGDGPARAGESRHAIESARLPLPPIAPHKAANDSLDYSGRTEKGKASHYGRKSTGRTMANGRAFNPRSNAAASKTLPLGTTAKVVNQENGESARVTIQDRGPHVDGRIIDVTPRVAEQLGMKKKGVVSVQVKPITVPQPNGAVRLGSGAAEASPKQIQQAVQATGELSKR